MRDASEMSRLFAGGVVDGVRFVDLIDAYCLRAYRVVGEQNEGQWVCSPLGMWLLLAACAGAARGEERLAIERRLGCSSDTAAEFLFRYLSSPGSAVDTAVASRVGEAEPSEKAEAWADRLPKSVSADAWASDEMARGARIVLACRETAELSWRAPFGLVAADEHLSSSSPWRGRVQRLFWDWGTTPMTGVFRTNVAGVVALHCTLANDDLTVLSVSADAHIAPETVLAGAHELVRRLRDRSGKVARCSLFDLPLGPGHSWDISEQESAARHPDEQVERIAGISLPAWRARSDLDLQGDEAFGASQALSVMRSIVPARSGDRAMAEQAVCASFNGFEVAGPSDWWSYPPPHEKRITRVATLRFDHPYAAIAITGHVNQHCSIFPGAPVTGLPVFAAWVTTPDEPQDTSVPSETRGWHALTVSRLML
jgi:hypothetical protein